MHRIGNNIWFSHTFSGILVLVFLEEIFEALDLSPLDHLYIDIGSHFIKLFDRFAYLASGLVVATNNLELGAHIACR